MRDGWHIVKTDPEKTGPFDWRCAVAQYWWNGRLVSERYAYGWNRWQAARRADRMGTALALSDLKL